MDFKEGKMTVYREMMVKIIKDMCNEQGTKMTAEQTRDILATIIKYEFKDDETADKLRIIEI